MIAYHSATTDSWEDTGKRGGPVGVRDGFGVHRGHVCFGCGETFLSEAAVVQHLASVHSAS